MGGLIGGSSSCYTFFMQLMLLGHPVQITVRKMLIWSVLAVIAAIVGLFTYYFVRSFFAIRANGSADAWLEQQLDSSVSRAIASAAVSDADLKALTREGRPSIGPVDAPLTVVTFIDYGCPYCRRSAGPLRETMLKYQKNVRFIMRDFPIEDIHPTAFQAAHAARCAFAQGKGWALHDALYTQQEAQSTADLERYAAQSGLDMNAYRSCMDKQQFASSIQEDLADGIRAGVQGTPTFFFNGVRIQGVPANQPQVFFDKLIQRFLQQPS